MDEKSKQDLARSIGTSSAIGAALLLYFGFVQLAEPTGASLFERSALLLYYTLRIGGVAAALTAVLLWSGWFAALALDAVVLLPIGAGLALSGLGMAIDGGGLLQLAICVLGGGLYIRAGLQSGRLWMGRDCPAAPTSEFNAASNRVPPREAAPVLPNRQAAELVPRGAGETSTKPSSPPRDPDHDPTPPAAIEPSPGYLASFARKPNSSDNP